MGDRNPKNVDEHDDGSASRSVDTKATDPGRRGALRTLVTAGGAVYAAAIFVPIARFLEVPASEGGGRWVKVARLDALPEGQPRRLEIVGDARDAFTLQKDERLGAVWVVRQGDAVRALSATCPHLGCAVDLADDKKSFACPCHTSRFSAAGDVESGPSPRGMDPLTARVVDGVIEIDFRKYRQGIPERQESA
jgi:cytochrome b6-f complex iron-sulfur subunit/menaquinol-cytochrome c reductase iron-sulfur subunit